MNLDAFNAAHAKYDADRSQIHVDAYDELIQLVCKHGNRRLKDQMWKLVDSTRAKTDAALAELKSASASALSASREGVTR